MANLRTDGWYKADKGKYFVLTEKGKQEVASYRHKTVGQPVSEYDYEASRYDYEEGYLTEVDIPDWIVKEGFEVVYDHKGYTLHAGNPIVFPEREIAEKYKEKYGSHPWMNHELYIKKSVFEGKALQECRFHEGKKVYNTSWYYGIDALLIGDLVEEEIVDDLINMLPPACMRSDCTQLGEAANHKLDENGKAKATYETFKKIAENTWEYCGDCFRGENVPSGKEIPML